MIRAFLRQIRLRREREHPGDAAGELEQARNTFQTDRVQYQRILTALAVTRSLPFAQLISGDDDTLIPSGNVQAVFAAAHEPKTLVWVAGEHIQPDEGLLIGRVADQVSGWLAARDLLPRSGPAPRF